MGALTAMAGETMAASEVQEQGAARLLRAAVRKGQVMTIMFMVRSAELVVGLRVVQDLFNPSVRCSL